MEKIVWNSNFSVGIDEIDNQHKKLISLINRLIDINEDVDKANLDEITAIVNELVKYVEYHFSSEEELMRRNGYPNLEEHKKEHLTFKKKVFEFLTKIIDQENAISTEILFYLRNWLITHILQTDMEYKEFFEQIDNIK